jgi:hypothetical protein
MRACQGASGGGTLAMFAEPRGDGTLSMTLEELRLMRLVQGILVRNYTDTQKLEIQVIGASVYIEGEFKVFDYRPSQGKQDPTERDLGVKRVISHVEQQIRGLGEVSHLEMKLKNWERVGMQWIPRRAGMSPSM